jgi:hypothetical protein
MQKRIGEMLNNRVGVSIAVVFFFALNYLMLRRQWSIKGPILIGGVALLAASIQVLVIGALISLKRLLGEWTTSATGFRNIPLLLRRGLAAWIDFFLSCGVLAVTLVCLRQYRGTCRSPELILCGLVCGGFFVLRDARLGSSVGRRICGIVATRRSLRDLPCGIGRSVARNLPLLAFFAITLLAADEQLQSCGLLNMLYLGVVIVMLLDAVLIGKIGRRSIDLFTGTEVFLKPPHRL